MAASSIVPRTNEDQTPSSMMAWRVHEFRPPEIMNFERVSRPEPCHGEFLVKVEAAGVGPWDGWMKVGKSALPQPLPLTLGSDLSGEIVALGPGVSELQVGDHAYGVFKVYRRLRRVRFGFRRDGIEKAKVANPC